MFKSRSQKYKRPFATPSAAANAAISPIDQPSRMTLFCMNCGKNNHGYAQCQEPLSSYGIICFCRNPGASPEPYQVVMVRRRHTMSYVEFLRGKYDVNNADYLVELFSGMTHCEIEFITQNPSFESLRRDLGMDNNWKRSYKAEYDNSELKFNYILNLGILANIIRAVNYIWGTEFPIVGNADLSPADKFWGSDAGEGDVTNGLGSCARIQELHTRYNPDGGKLHQEPEWGIPKGKRQNKETDLQCAIREFQEETQLAASGGTLRVYKNIIPLEENYKGGNGVEYRHIYFIAELNNHANSFVSKSDKPVVADVAEVDTKEREIDSDEEIGAVGLFNMQDGLAQIRDYHVSKKNIIQKAFYIINSLGHFFTAGF